MFDKLRRCLNLHTEGSATQHTWLELGNIASNSFRKSFTLEFRIPLFALICNFCSVPVTRNLASEMSPSRDSLSQLRRLVVEIPQTISPTGSSVSSFSSSKSLLGIFLVPRNSLHINSTFCLIVPASKSLIPVSLMASRFDMNSFRRLSDLLDTVGLSRYSGNYLGLKFTRIFAFEKYLFYFRFFS